MTQPRILDLFAGPGGWSEGLRLLGLDDIGIEWDASACTTRAAAAHLTVRADVAQLATAPMAGRISGFIASPPCQAWSRAGKRLGIADQPLVHQAVQDLAKGRDTRPQLLAACKDPRSLLAAEPMRYLHAIRPEWIALEEVPDVLPLFRQYAETLRGWGYSVWAGELNAADYGVPQTRRRAILIASRVRSVQPPTPTHAREAAEAGLFGRGRDRWVSMAEALGWDSGLIVNTCGERKTPGGNEFPADEPSQTLVKSTRSWALRNGNQPGAAVRPADGPAPTMAFGNNAARVEWVLRNGTQANAAVRTLDEPSGTLFFGARCNDVSWVQTRPATTVCATDRIAPPGHRDRSPSGESQFASPETVRITVAEASVLQSFPAAYPWQGTKTKQFEQVGNAVPPLLAAHVVAAATGLPMPARLNSTALSAA